MDNHFGTGQREEVIKCLNLVKVLNVNALNSTPSVPLKLSQFLPAKTVIQPDWDGFSGTEGIRVYLQKEG